MAGTFDERINHLMDEVGSGHIVAGCSVNQPYAQDQHETLTYRHTEGRSRYLGGPLLENAFDSMQQIANSVITETGSDLYNGMKGQAEAMAGYVEEYAPVGGGNTHLRTSASPFVIDEGVESYRRPPGTPRDEDEHI